MFDKRTLQSVAFATLALLIAPALSFFISQWLVRSRGPFTFGEGQDPEYAYLMNAVSLSELRAPAHTDHPGTTLQTLGAVVFTAKWLFSGKQGVSLRDSVLQDPENYLWALNITLNILVSTALFSAGWTMWRTSGSMAAALVLQMGIFLFRENFGALSRVSPEPLIIAVVYALIALIVPILWNGEGNPILTGAMVACGIVTKVTFIPLILVIALFERWKARWRFVAALLLTGVILLIPIARQIPRVFGWLYSIASHRGIYGTGEAGLPEKGYLLNSLAIFYSTEPYFFYVVATAITLLAALFLAGRRDPFTERAKRLLLIGTIILFAQVAIVIKHYASHYILPGFVFASLVVSTIYLILASEALPRAVRRTLAVACAALFVMGLWRSATMTRLLADNASANRTSIVRMAEVRSQQVGCTTIGFYRSSAPGFALFFGDGFASRLSGPELSRLYPDLIFFERFGGHFQTFDGLDVTARVKDMVSSGACVLMEGMTIESYPLVLPSGMRLEPIEVTKIEGLYRLRMN